MIAFALRSCLEESSLIQKNLDLDLITLSEWSWLKAPRPQNLMNE